MAALHVVDEVDGKAWQVWPSPDPIPVGRVREAGSYLFELRDADDPQAFDLLVDDVPLEALRSRQLGTARWRWQPGFHAGVVEAELRVPGGGPRRFEITTDPDLRKLTRDDFDGMVREILEDTRALFSPSAFRKGIARQVGERPPPLARLEFLRSRALEIVRTVQEIGRAPRRALRAEEVTVPAHRAVRVTGPEIVRSLRSGIVLAETVGSSRLPPSLRGRLPARVTQRRRQASVDIPEHRQIRACLKSWAAWMSVMAERLERRDDGRNREDATTAARWAARTRGTARRLEDAASDGFMADVGEGPATLHMSGIFRNDPAYRRFHRLWQDMNVGLAALFGEFLQMPLARTHDLYELWCFLRLLRAAVDEYGVTDVNVAGLFAPDASGGVTLTANGAVVSVGAERLLCFQRRYREYWVEPSGEGSFSRIMVPDIVMAGTGPGRGARRMIVLDAKYRIDAGLNDALGSIHTYRDALVREIDDGRIEGVVAAAYLLTPHLPQQLGADFRATPVPGRLFHPAYREKFRFGAVTLRPGMNGEELRHALRTIVADASAVA